jgi:hypothetical protein
MSVKGVSILTSVEGGRRAREKQHICRFSKYLWHGSLWWGSGVKMLTSCVARLNILTMLAG